MPEKVLCSYAYSLSRDDNFGCGDVEHCVLDDDALPDKERISPYLGGNRAIETTLFGNAHGGAATQAWDRAGCYT